MYKSPIELIYKDAQYKIEEGIYKAIQKIDIKVDREELIKALEYDRGQYNKGYEDGKAERKKGKWVRDEFGIYCSCCGYYAYRDKFGRPWESNFCPNCGADMRGEQDAKTN